MNEKIIIFPSKILFHKNLKPLSKLLMAEIIFVKEKYGICKKPTIFFAKKIHRTEVSTFTALCELKREMLITKTITNCRNSIIMIDKRVFEDDQTLSDFPKYIKMPKSIFKIPNLSLNQIFCLGIIMFIIENKLFDSSNEECFLKNSFFSKIFNVKLQTVVKWIEELESKGLIRKNRICKKDNAGHKKIIRSLSIVKLKEDRNVRTKRN